MQSQQGRSSLWSGRTLKVRIDQTFSVESCEAESRNLRNGAAAVW